MKYKFFLFLFFTFFISSSQTINLNESYLTDYLRISQLLGEFKSDFSSAREPRRYWKDFNLHANFSKKYKQFWLFSNLMYSKSLNYQWDLDDTATPYYHPGNDVNNFHMTLKLAYLIPLAN